MLKLVTYNQYQSAQIFTDNNFDLTHTYPTAPTEAPTWAPIAPTVEPTASTVAPTVEPTASTVAPTVAPTEEPTAPTVAPTVDPIAPTVAPTEELMAPTVAPTEEPTAPTVAPTWAPIAPTELMILVGKKLLVDVVERLSPVLGESVSGGPLLPAECGPPEPDPLSSEGVLWKNPVPKSTR